MKIIPAISLVLAAAVLLAGAAFPIHQIVVHEEGDSTCSLVLVDFILTGYIISRLSAFTTLKAHPIVAPGRNATWRLDRPPRH